MTENRGIPIIITLDEMEIEKKDFKNGKKYK
jgi:hypothetical protein